MAVAVLLSGGCHPATPGGRPTDRGIETVDLTRAFSANPSPMRP